jgi:NADH-quinone oxidoreductase subunit N
MMAVVAVVAGLSFRMTAVPFHFYAPDVFQGAPTSGAAMLAFVPKIAGFVALLRLVAFTPATLPEGGWTLAGRALPVLWMIAVVSMFGGNLMALVQTNVKRLLAWSSIAHAGYMLVGVVAGDKAGVAVTGRDALLFYLVAYGAMTVGVFAILAALSRQGRKYETLDDLAGLSQTNPALALLMAIFLFSLSGLPPTGGFLGKLNLFLAAWGEGSSSSRLLAILLAANAAIGAWYYLRVVGAMYLQRPRTTEAVQPEVPATIAAAVCLVATLGLFVVPNALWTMVRR